MTRDDHPPDPDDLVVCPSCHGTGEYEIRAFVGGASPYDRREPCYYCDGDGFVPLYVARKYERDRGR